MAIARFIPRQKGSKLPAAWTKVRLDPRQYAFFHSSVRVNVVAAGRRSFKTEGAIRRLVRRAIAKQKHRDTRYFACGPTQQQAKDIFWERILRMLPQWALLTPQNPAASISQVELVIKLWHGGILKVAGLDRPERIEGGQGGFWDGGVIDEFANCKPNILDAHIRPMMIRGGWLDVTGVPEGRGNNFYTVYDQALRDKTGESVAHHWRTSEVLHLYLGIEAAAKEIAYAMSTMDRLLYRQEYDADFVSYEGKAYYCFDESKHVCPLGERVRYNPELPIITCWDFNSSPGVLVLCQEQVAPKWLQRKQLCPPRVTAIFDEIYVPKNSNTKRICQKFLEKYGQHKEEVHLYGDPAGGAKTSQQTEGSDWDIAENMLKPFYGKRLKNYVARAHPPVRVRVNCVNTRMETADGTIGIIIDNKKCPMTIRDFEQVESDAAGDIIKKKGSPLTHLSDGFGYYIAERFPLSHGGLQIGAC